jgi:protein-S-isoprenylcysteine O-methyltransferase Ste14
MKIKLSCVLIEVILLPLQTSTPNQIFAHVPPTSILISFIVTTPILILVLVLWCWSWAQPNIINPFKEAAPRRLKLHRLC